MNTLKIKLNPYKDINIASLDDKPLSPYSELNNYLKEPFLKWAHKLLDTAEREINDDYALTVAAEEFEKLFLQDMQRGFEACKSYEQDGFPFDATVGERYKAITCLAEKYEFFYQATKLPVYSELQIAWENNPAIPVALEEAFLVITKETENVRRLVNKTGEVIVLCLSGRNAVTCLGDMQYLWEIEEDRLDTVLACIFDRFAKIPDIIKIANELSGIHMPAADKQQLMMVTEIDRFVTIEDIDDIEVGQSTKVLIRTFPDDGVVPELRLVSSNPAIVAVDGLWLTAVAPGRVYIDIYRNEENIPLERKEVTTYQDNVVKKIQLSLNESTMGIGRSQQIGITLAPADAEDAGFIRWETDDRSVASIDNKGVVTAVSAGKVTVTAKAAKTSASITLEVLPNIMNIVSSIKDIMLYVGQTQKITVTTVPGNCFDNSYTWKSNNERVAVVETLGDGTTVIKAIGFGECILTCTAKEGGCSTSCAVKVGSRLKQNEKMHTMLSATFVCTIITLFCAVFPIGAILPVLGAVATLICGVLAIKRNISDGFWALLLMGASVAIAIIKLQIF